MRHPKTLENCLIDNFQVSDYTESLVSSEMFITRGNMFDKIDWAFIVAEEGDWSIGYVPNVKNPKSGKINSGASIVSGFDLGQQTKGSLRARHLSEVHSLSRLIPTEGVSRRFKWLECVERSSV